MGYGELTSYHLAHTTEQGTKLHLKEPPIAWTGTLDHSGQPSNRKSEHYSFRVSQEISQTDFPAESQPGHFYRPGANKPGLRAQRQDYGDLIWMYFPPFLQLFKIQLLPCSCNTASALLPARNEDKEPPLRPNPKPFLQTSWWKLHQRLKASASLGGTRYSGWCSALPTRSSSHPFSFLCSIFPLLGLCLNPWQLGTRCKFKQ